MSKVLLYAVTSFESHVLVDGLIHLLPPTRYQVHFASSPCKGVYSPKDPSNISYHSVNMERNPSIFQDLLSLFNVFLLILRVRPSIVNYSTPKAALLYSLAAFALRVPHRVYLVRGLRYTSIPNGFSRYIYIMIERLVCLLSTHNIALSNSVHDQMINEDLSLSSKCCVIGPSGSGTPLQFFTPTVDPIHVSEDFVVGFCGRFIQRKGILELVESVSNLR